MWTKDSDRYEAWRKTGWARLFVTAAAWLFMGQAFAQVTPPPEAVFLSAAPGSVHVGEAVVLTAQNNHVSYYTGLEMRFFEDGVAIPSCSAVTLNPNNNSATCTVTSASYGARQYSASLGSMPGGPDMAVSNVVAVVFDRWNASVGLVMDVPDPALGQMVTFSVLVSGHFPTGDVSFYDALGPNPALPLCTSTLLPGGSIPPSATCATVIVRTGLHRISAHYHGDNGNWEAWSGDLDFNVASAQAQSSTVLGVAPPVPVAGEPAVVTVSVSGLSPGGGVVILDGTATVCTEFLDASPADTKAMACDWVFSAAGQHELSASYAGDSNNFPSSAILSVQVDAAPLVPVQVHLVTVPVDAQAGQSAVLRAEIFGAVQGATVTFLDGGAELPGCAQVPIAWHGGDFATADCVLLFPPRGQREFAAIYRSGALTRNAVLQRQIPGRATTTTLGLVSGAAWVDQPVVLQATVTGDSLRAGTVRFRDGAAVIASCGAAPLTPLAPRRMVADCVTDFQVAGRHALVAEFAGGPYAAPSSGGLALEVGANAPALLLTALNLPFVDQPVAMRATLNGLPLGGTMAFGRDGQTIAGCEAVVPVGPTGAAAFAECFTAFAAAGPHALQANYAFAGGSESAEIDIDVEAYPTATRLRVEPPPGGAREGEAVWLHAEVWPASAAGGQVAFGTDLAGFDGCQAAVLTADGGNVAVAGCEAILRDPGVRTLHAMFSGDRVHAPSSDSLSVTVAAQSGSLLLSAPDGAVVGEPSRLQATASGASPAGPVDFSDDGAAIPGCQALPLGIPAAGVAVAECVARFPLAGLHLLGAGHDTGNGRTQAALTIDVARATSSIDLVPHQTPGAASLAFEARVDGHFPGGTVAFRSEGVPVAGCEAVVLETLSTRAASATCTLPTGSAPRWVSASYPGDDNNAPSEDIHAVAGMIESSLELVRVDPGPAYAGRTLTLQARVSGAAPTGSVRFLDGQEAIAGCDAVPLVAVAAGVLAQCGARLAGATAHALHAEYSGDAVNTPAAGSLTLAVVKNPTSTQLEIVGAGASYAGASVRLRATVDGLAPGGRVAFLADDVEIAGCGAVTLQRSSPDADIGQAECVTVFAQAGARTLAARFGGDDANAASHDELVQVSVRQAPMVSGAARIAFFGQQAVRFTLHNPEAAPAPEVRVSFDATQAVRIAFMPVCSTGVGGGGGSVSCENPLDLGISCTHDAATRSCTVAALASGASLSFVVFPSAAAAPLQVSVSIAGATVSQTILDPDH